MHAVWIDVCSVVTSEAGLNDLPDDLVGEPDPDGDMGWKWDLFGGAGDPSWSLGAEQRWSSILEPCCQREI